MSNASNLQVINDALFKALVQHSADVLIYTNPRLDFLYINDAITSVLGYYPDELKGYSLYDMVVTDDHEILSNWVSKLLQHQGSDFYPVELRAKTSIGNLLYVQVWGKKLVMDEQENGLVITLRDVQSKKIADMALQQAEQRISMLLNNTKESFIVLNSGGVVIAYNRAAQESSPYFLANELQSGLLLTDLVSDAEKTAYTQLLNNVNKHTAQRRMSFFTDAHGVQHIYEHIFRFLHLGGDQTGIFITSADVTQEHLAALSLQRSEEKFKTIIEYSFDAILILDPDATIRYASPSISSLIGFTSEEMMGKNGFDFIHPDDLQDVYNKFMSIVNEIDETYADYRCLTNTGDYIWIEAKGKNMLNNQLINGMLVSLRDISQRKKLIEEQTALTNELIKYNKDLQQFSFITSHNLRAPVANLISLISLYNRRNLGDAFNGELLNKFEESTNQLNETLNDLISVLVIRSKQNADAEYLRFEDVTAGALRNVQSLLKEAGGEVTTRFEAEGVEYNKVHLESIFLNLLSNAIKYASPDRKLQIKITSEPTGEGVRLCFSDNGIGIDLNRYGDRLFGLYQRFHAGKQGKGLGLYMIKSQILASGGSIKVESEPGIGTSFIIHFKHQQVRS